MYKCYIDLSAHYKNEKSRMKGKFKPLVNINEDLPETFYNVPSAGDSFSKKQEDTSSSTCTTSGTTPTPFTDWKTLGICPLNSFWFPLDILAQKKEILDWRLYFITCHECCALVSVRVEKQLVIFWPSFSLSFVQNLTLDLRVCLLCIFKLMIYVNVQNFSSQNPKVCCLLLGNHSHLRVCAYIMLWVSIFVLRIWIIPDVSNAIFNSRSLWLINFYEAKLMLNFLFLFHKNKIIPNWVRI